MYKHVLQETRLVDVKLMVVNIIKTAHKNPLRVSKTLKNIEYYIVFFSK